MLFAGTMTAFARDSVRYRPGEPRLGSKSVVRAGSLRVRVVAEHAVVANETLSARMVRRVVPGAHSPVAASFGVPAHRQFCQGSTRGQMQVRPSMVARPKNEINSL